MEQICDLRIFLAFYNGTNLLLIKPYIINSY